MYQSNQKLVIKLFISINIFIILTSCSGSSDNNTLPASDTTLPTIVSTVPIDGDIDILDSTSIQFIFSKDMNKQSVEAGFVIDSGVTGTVIYDETNRTATFNADSSTIVGDKIYSVILRNTIKDLAGNFIKGNQVNGDYSWSFTTLDNVRPTIVTRRPDNDPKGINPIAANRNIEVNFSEELSKLSLDGNFTVKSENSLTPLQGIFTVNGSNVTFNPDLALNFNTVYTVTLSQNLKDLKNNSLITQGTQEIYTFKTEPVSIAGYNLKYPIDKAINIERKPLIQIEFTNPMNIDQFNSNTFKITDPLGNPILGVYSVQLATNNTKFIAQFKPTDNLSLLATYQITLVSLIDVNGNPIEYKNKGISTFTIKNGTWQLATETIFDSVIIGASPIYYTADNNKKGDAIITWQIISAGSYQLYSKYHNSISGWETQQKNIISGKVNSYIYHSNVVIDQVGKAMILWRHANLTDPLSSTVHNYASRYKNGSWSITPTQIDRATDTSNDPSLAISPDGTIVAAWGYSSTVDPGALITRRFIPSALSSINEHWEALEVIGKEGTFNGTIATGRSGLKHISISDSGTPIAFYAQSDGVNENLWVNSSPFKLNTPILLESSAQNLHFSGIAVTSTNNNKKIVFFQLADNTRWVNTYTSTSGWGQAKQITTIGSTAYFLNAIIFRNDKQFVYFIENNILKSTEFLPATNTWSIPLTIVSNITDAKISYFKDSNTVVASWANLNGIYTKTYLPSIGWQNTNPITEDPSGQIKAGAPIILRNLNGSALAIWGQGNAITNNTDIFSKTLQ